jgi:hypothetical protein
MQLGISKRKLCVSPVSVREWCDRGELWNILIYNIRTVLLIETDSFDIRIQGTDTQ